MASKDQIIDALIGVIVGVRGGIGGENPNLGIPPFFEALEQDRRRGSKARKQAKRQVSKAQKAYGRAFKRLAPRYKKKNGSWKKDGFKRCVRAAHRECRRKH